jgi:3-hydroxy-9,10-secoandrosta-1,3,5(10)-triene-9,17-dione monooxygenase reductase component
MSGTNTFDPGQFRKALGSFTTGVTVVTTRAQDGSDIGMTANSFNSVSLEPPMVLWSLGKSSLSLPAFEAAEYFAVHVLAQDQEPLSGQFARRGADKFAGVSLERGPNDIPLLTKYAARFVCRTAFKYEGGDHIIFVGEVVEFDHHDIAPLLFHSGQYAQLLKKQVSPTDSSHKDVASDFSQDFLGYLLGRSYQQLFAPIKVELKRRALSVPQYYLISLLAQFDDKSLDQLGDVLELGDNRPSDSEVDVLLKRGLIQISHDDNKEKVRLSPDGIQLHVELASQFKAIEADAEKDLDYDTRQSLKLALRQLIQTTDPGPPDSWS